jgi:DNA-binding NarL/FixJ family response regulator
MAHDITPEKSAKYPYRVLIVDDHELARGGLRSIFSCTPGFEVVGEADNGYQALELCQQLKPDLVLLDIQMPVINGLAVAQKLKVTMPGIRIVILTIHDNVDYLLEALRVGVDGYLHKDATMVEILKVIDLALMGNTAIESGLAARALQQIVCRVSPIVTLAHTPLTVREQEVLVYITFGKTNSEIAQLLGISTGTVKNHIHHIITKLEVSDRRQALLRALELGLIRLPLKKENPSPGDYPTLHLDTNPEG